MSIRINRHELETFLLDRGLWWGHYAQRPPHFTCNLGLEPYSVDEVEREFYSRCRRLLPWFRRAVLRLVQDSWRDNREGNQAGIGWLWDQLTFGRNSYQVYLWERELSRIPSGWVLPILRDRPDVIRSASGLKIGELTLGATWMGFEAILAWGCKEVFGSQYRLFPPNAVIYLSTIRELFPNEQEVHWGIAVTPWRSLYSAEQRALAGRLNYLAQLLSIPVTVHFGLTTDFEPSARRGVSINGQPLHGIERVFKEYLATGKDAQAPKDLDFDPIAVAEVERAIIEAYLQGKVVLNPNLLTFLDYKQTQAWIFDPRLEKRLVHYLGGGSLGCRRLEGLRSLFVETHVLDPTAEGFLLSGVEYPWDSLENLRGYQRRRRYEIRFGWGCRLEEIIADDGQKSMEKPLEWMWLTDQTGGLDRLEDWARRHTGTVVTVPEELAANINLMSGMPRQIQISVSEGGWTLQVFDPRPVLERDLVLKLSGGSNRAAGSKGIVISVRHNATEWRGQQRDFRGLAAQQPVVYQPFHHPLPRPATWIDPYMPWSAFEGEVLDRLNPYFWYPSGREEARLGGMIVTSLPTDDPEAPLVHGRSTSIISSACWG